MTRKPGRLIGWGIFALAALQLYIVQELVAALLLFTVVFLAFAALVWLLRLLQLGWERAYLWGQGALDTPSQKLLRRLRSEIAR